MGGVREEVQKAAHERELPLLLDSFKLSSIHDLGRQTNKNRRETKSNKQHKDKMPVNVLIRRRKRICHTLRKKATIASRVSHLPMKILTGDIFSLIATRIELRPNNFI